MSMWSGVSPTRLIASGNAQAGAMPIRRGSSAYTADGTKRASG